MRETGTTAPQPYNRGAHQHGNGPGGNPWTAAGPVTFGPFTQVHDPPTNPWRRAESTSAPPHSCALWKPFQRQIGHNLDFSSPRKPTIPMSYQQSRLDSPVHGYTSECSKVYSGQLQGNKITWPIKFLQWLHTNALKSSPRVISGYTTLFNELIYIYIFYPTWTDSVFARSERI